MRKIDNPEHLREIVKRYLAGKATAKEESFLEAYFKHFDSHYNITDLLGEDERIALRDKMEASILERITVAERSNIRVLPMVLKIAAAALIFVSVGVYLFYSNTSEPAVATTDDHHPVDVLPGGNKAFLTLADGSRISLNDAKVGELTWQGNSVVHKTTDGELSYDKVGTNDPAVVGSNSIETPRGGEYQVTLTDGTRVWLNAASKLVFPTAFSGKERRVELTGEAYFEVAQNKAMPFKVTSGDQTIEVLGTHFNINAYPDEAVIRTTLVEGSVRVSDESSTGLLKPGEQSVVKKGEAIRILAVNTSDVVAWKNGLFVFANDNVEGVMRKISRWYDIDVHYTGSITREGFVGSVSKFENLSEVLSALELTGLVHFRIEERRVTVMP